jgi:hypothetical protein
MLWLRALPDQHVLVSGSYGCVQLKPGQAVAFDGSPQHNAVVDEIREGVSPLEVVEADADPSLSSPPDESEQRARAAVEDAQRKTASHERLIARPNPADAPPPKPAETPTTPQED